MPIGLGGGGRCYSATEPAIAATVDDALDASSPSTVSAGLGSGRDRRSRNKGPTGQVGTQLLVSTIGYAVVATFIIVKVVDVVLGIRVPSAEGQTKLAVHGEAAYQV